MVRRHSAKLALGLFVASAVVLTPSLAFAADGPTFDPAGALPTTGDGFGLNLLWIILGAAMVIFMQAGFAMVETGFCRAKHAVHVISTNMAIFGLGFVAFFAVVVISVVVSLIVVVTQHNIFVVIVRHVIC